MTNSLAVLDRHSGAVGSPEGRYPEPVVSAEDWSVERHLADKPKDVVDLYERFVALVAACGPFSFK